MHRRPLQMSWEELVLNFNSANSNGIFDDEVRVLDIGFETTFLDAGNE